MTATDTAGSTVSGRRRSVRSARCRPGLAVLTITTCIRPSDRARTVLSARAAVTRIGLVPEPRQAARLGKRADIDDDALSDTPTD